MAKAKQRIVVQLERLVAEQPRISRYEIDDVVEDAARQSATRMGTVGLAFSGGGIRSATFNLGFLQGAATLGLLKQFDYLSTVSGGGYIGVVRGMGPPRRGGREPRPARRTDFIRGLAALSAAAEKRSTTRYSRLTTGRRPAGVGGCPAGKNRRCENASPEAARTTIVVLD